MVLGGLFAAWFVFVAIDRGSTLGDVFVSAWVGFLVGMVVGIPVSWLLSVV